MFESEVQICNAALSRIGVTELLEGTTLSLEEAEDGTEDVSREQCRVWYPQARDLLLRRHPWPFATLRASLAEIPAERRSDWDYAYGLPATMLALREVLMPGLRNPRPDQRIPHRIEARVGPSGEVIGKVLLCGEDEVDIRYTVRVTNVMAFPDDFAFALARLLAALLAPPIVKGEEGDRLSTTCMNEAEWLIRQAWASARGEENPDPEPTSTFEAARR